MFDLCPPAVWTQPLSADFPSDGPRLRQIVKAAWVSPENPDGITLDQWQADLLDALLERYPADHPDPDLAGRLRYRQVVVSIPRQHGKSLLGAILALYGLLIHCNGPYVVGVASNVDQANLIYNRVLFTINANEDLKKRFSRATETRGIRTKDGSGVYQVKASKGSALQGIPASLSLIDELHIVKPELWQSLVNGSITRDDGLVVGITTAGDDNSELLKTLYDLGQKAAGGDATLERFGFFVWEAPESRVPTDEAELKDFILVSNPAVAEGRLKISTVLSDIRAMPPTDVTRYRLNRFVASSTSFIDLASWQACASSDEWPAGQPVFGVDKSPDGGYATITAAIKDEHGIVHTEVVASLVKPSLDTLLTSCLSLTKFAPRAFFLDSYTLSSLAKELKARGLTVEFVRQSDVQTASGVLYTKVKQRELKHANDALLSSQIPRTVRKNVGEGWRISRQDSSAEIDSVMATAYAVYGTEMLTETAPQLFI